MTPLEHQVTAIAQRLVRGTLLESWEIRIRENDLPLDTAAEVTVEPDHAVASLKITPSWADRAIIGLEAIIAHELGHCITDEFLDYLPDGQARNNAQERLASVVGNLLVLRNPAD